MNSIVFLVLALLTIGAAMMVVLSRNPISSILFLVLVFFSLAAFYVALGAQFIAAVQIIVYAGAIMVLFLFVVMLLNLKKIEEKASVPLRTLGIVTAGILVALLLAVISKTNPALNPATGLTATKTIGQLLFTQYLVPFEIAGILLLTAIVGAVVLVKKPNI